MTATIIPTYPDLAGKVALLTGATGGIGSETARWLARNQVKLALTSRTPDRLATLVNKLTNLGSETISGSPTSRA